MTSLALEAAHAPHTTLGQLLLPLATDSSQVVDIFHNSPHGIHMDGLNEHLLSGLWKEAAATKKCPS